MNTLTMPRLASIVFLLTAGCAQDQEEGTTTVTVYYAEVALEECPDPHDGKLDNKVDLGDATFLIYGTAQSNPGLLCRYSASGSLLGAYREAGNREATTHRYISQGGKRIEGVKQVFEPYNPGLEGR
jgi:hypothetical protein